MKSNELRINYGGQAVIEGVMMRGRKKSVTAVRHPAGHIVVHGELLGPGRLAARFRRVYFLRGMVSVWEMLFVGMRSLSFSARVQMTATEGEDPVDDASTFVAGSLVIGLVAGIGLFFVLPLIITSFFDQFVASDLLSNVIEGGVRLGVFVAYITSIGFMPDIRRVWMYHGAEHKTINALEAGQVLTIGNVQSQSRTHPRCGTAFLVMLVVVSVVIFAFLGRPPFILRLLSRVALLPIIAGVGFELIMFTARYRTNLISRIVAAPGIWFQRLTTREPDDAQVEVAIVAMDRVLVAEDALASLRPKTLPVLVAE